MGDSWQASVVLITSSDPGESHFGTGFVIHNDKQATYLLTCTHVVRDIGGPEKIQINGTQARISASSPEEGADLAVLYIERLLDIPPIPLQVASEKGEPFSTAGFQLDGKQYLIRELHGTLGKQVGVQMKGQADRIKAWDLEITDKYPLQPGYSGSPVVDEHDNVIGVVNTRRGEGKTGVAIVIEALEKAWPEMPPDLFERGKIGFIKKKDHSFFWSMNISFLRFLVISVCILLLIGGSSRLFYINYYLPGQRRISATANAQVIRTNIARVNATATAEMADVKNPYPPYEGTLLLNQSLSENTKNPVWDEGTTPGTGSCTFVNTAYYAEIQQAGQFYYCNAEATTFRNFAYQAQMTFIKGDNAGISFRSVAVGSLYYFYINAQGMYELDLNKEHNFIKAISSGSSSAIKKGFGQSNLLGVVARGNSFDLYVNLHHVAHGTDATFSSGLIGILVLEQSHQTEASFRYVKVWKL